MSDLVETRRLYKNTVTAGLTLRRDVRASLDLIGVEWHEYKGLLESTFVVTGTRDQWDTINAWIRRVNS